MHIKDVPKKLGKTVKLRGWVFRIRKQKDLVFIILRDSSGIIQLTCKKTSESEKVTIESSIEVEGKVKKDKRAPGGYEIKIDKLKIIGLAERFPITKDQSAKFLRDVRHLWLRSRKMTLMLKIRSEVFRAIHDFYSHKGFIEFQSPILTKCACEGGATLFSVDHPQKPIYLSQSWQLYAEAGIFSLEKIYTITPAFRAEKSRTIRHLAEYWTAEAEAAWMSFEELLKHQEELILHIAKHILKHCKKELKELGRDLKELEKLKTPFKRIPYKEAIKILGKKWGHDLTDKEERELVKKLGDKPVFLTSFPRDMKAFYMKVDPKDPKTVLAADLLLPRVGEVTGGSERISDIKELLESIKLFKLDKKDYEWYIDLRRYGTVPHSGFGLGIERLIMWLTGAKHIMDTIPFPRTMDRIYP
ncbi:MAG: asparagine--tRNA ligase [Candidatus Aenigmatarchaeota archaeon]